MLTQFKDERGTWQFHFFALRVGEICDSELQDNLQNGKGGGEKVKTLAARGSDTRLTKVSSERSLNGSLQSGNGTSQVASTRSLNVVTDDKTSRDNEREYDLQSDVFILRLPASNLFCC
jgi:hypothetical protein